MREQSPKDKATGKIRRTKWAVPFDTPSFWYCFVLYPCQFVLSVHLRNLRFILVCLLFFPVRSALGSLMVKSCFGFRVLDTIGFAGILEPV